MFAPQRKPNPTQTKTKTKKGAASMSHHSAGLPKSQMLRRGPTAGATSRWESDRGLARVHQPHGPRRRGARSASEGRTGSRGSAAKSSSDDDGGRLAKPLTLNFGVPLMRDQAGDGSPAILIDWTPEPAFDAPMLWLANHNQNQPSRGRKSSTRSPSTNSSTTTSGSRSASPRATRAPSSRRATSPPTRARIEAQRTRGQYLRVVLDADDLPEAVTRDRMARAVAAAIEGRAFVFWSTASATPDEPRWKIAIPMTTPIPPDDYQPAAEALGSIVSA